MNASLGNFRHVLQWGEKIFSGAIVSIAPSDLRVDIIFSVASTAVNEGRELMVFWGEGALPPQLTIPFVDDANRLQFGTQWTAVDRLLRTGG